MPELPEVENVRRTLAVRLAGKNLQDCRIHFPGTITFHGKWERPSVPAAFLEARRHGKFLRLVFREQQSLLAHFRMTGAFYFRSARDPALPHTHVEFTLCSGEILAYRDPRRFGHVWWFSGVDAFAVPPLAQTGPDALQVGKEEFTRSIRNHRRMLKPLLLDQRLVAGLGNIYVDEMLFRARIHPRQSSDRISKRKVDELWKVMREILFDSIAKGGSSIRDFVDSEGRAGRYQREHQVYGKEGEPCPRCGTPLERILVGQRGTTLCPRCQRLR
jgi:formamidopyrimidine-DNA glycosylase